VPSDRPGDDPEADGKLDRREEPVPDDDMGRDEVGDRQRGTRDEAALTCSARDEHP
jgi:hypothetical protein